MDNTDTAQRYGKEKAFIYEVLNVWMTSKQPRDLVKEKLVRYGVIAIINIGKCAKINHI